MNTPIFPNGITGLSDTKWSGSQGNAHRLVGVDFRSEPGIIKSHQKLKKISSTFAGEVETNIVTELCKNVVELSDGTKLWFSSESGKIWKQVGDVFTLIHTVVPATDFKEPNSIIDGVWDNDDIESGISMSIAENDAVYGTISQNYLSVFDTTRGFNNSVIKMGLYYVVAYAGELNDGYLKSFTVSRTGTVSIVETLEHDTDNGTNNSLCKISDTHAILAYNGGASNHGFIKTFSGPTTLVQLNSLEHDTDTTGNGYNSLIQLDATHYVLAYAGGASNHGMIKIFTIDGAYAITQTSSLTHDNTGATTSHKIIKLDATHFILSYRNASSEAIVKTFSIDAAYAITEIDSYTHSTGVLVKSDFISLDATHFAWTGILTNRGYIKTIEIDGSFQISEKSSKDMFDNNLCPSLFKTDETHIVLSSARSSSSYIKTFVFDSDYKFTELHRDDFIGYQCSETLTLRDVDNIMTFYTYAQTNAVCTSVMNETYSNGIILKPSGTQDIELIASKFISQKNMIDGYLRETIKIPAGFDNMNIVVITGNAYSSSNPAIGATVEGNAMTEICNRSTAFGFLASSAFYNYKNPSVGDNDIVVNFGGAVAYAYLIILAFKNVHQTTPYSSTFDYGWQDYLELPGTVNGELKVGAFLTKINPHYSGALQDSIGSMDISEDDKRYTISVGLRKFSIGTAKILGASDFSYIQSEELATETSEYVPEEKILKVYYANEDVLFAIKEDKIDSWASNIETIGMFPNGDDTYHSMVKQNLELFIGDDTVISKVNSNGEFVPETAFNVGKPERIQVLSKFDTDILVGTKDVNTARVLRWDTFSDSWYADDDVMESGINAFIRDDNYTYVSAGDYGRIYFYNGEKLKITKRIPGVWNGSNKGVVNENAVDYYMGVPVFGLSATTGNPALQGIYGFGNYDDKYVKAMSLDYPLSTNEFSGVTIGVIHVNGIDMWVSYKTATDVGIARIDHLNKYNNAYIETMMLTAQSERDQDSIIEGICADYISLPANTDVEIGVKTKYDTSYIDMTTITDTDRMTIKTKNTPKINNLQVKFNLVSSGNTCPEIENFGLL